MSLQCTVSGQPPPRVSWQLDGAELPPQLLPTYQLGSFVSRRGHVVSHLNVSAARVEHGGLYTCLARNILGATQHSAPINVYGEGALLGTRPHAAFVVLHSPLQKETHRGIHSSPAFNTTMLVKNGVDEFGEHLTCH